MKKSLYVIFSILLLCSLVAICCLTALDGSSLAYAETGSNYTFAVGTRNVTLYTVFNDANKPIGARIREYFFGDSFIPVEVNVYSSDNFKIDFSMGASESTLSPEQLSNRQALIDLFAEIVTYVDRVDALANAQSAGLNGQSPSDVYRYNNPSDDDDKTEVVNGGYKIEISEETYEMLEIAQEMYTVTGGAFNPAVYRLVDLWGFSSRTYRSNGNLPYDRKWVDYNNYPLPEQKYITAFSNESFTDFSENSVVLTEENGSYFVTKKVSQAVVGNESYEQWIDLGGIAKGYVVDAVKAKLYAAGIDRFNVDAGSSSIAFGLSSSGGSNRLLVNNAFNKYSDIYQETVLALDVGKSSISTSGQNIRKYAVDGVEYAHIIDGTTGAPAQTGVRSVTVAVGAGSEASDFWATRGDCLTTALTVMGYDRIVEFMGDYLETNGIKIVVQYETVSGKKQLLSTFDKKEMPFVSENYGELKWDERGFFYADYVEESYDYIWVLILLGCLFGAGAIALVVYHFVRGKNRTATNVQNAKKSKPFKLLDVMVYIGVVLVILVLFYVFLFDVETKPMQLVNVVDDQTGETLFTYNFVRNEYKIYDNANGWTVDVSRFDEGLVTFTREIDGEQRFNTVKIDKAAVTVVMSDSRCGYHQDCVRSFSAIERSGGVIVCSPNRLKIVTE